MKFLATRKAPIAATATAATPPGAAQRQRGCPRCGRGIERVARRWFDRLLGWGAPLKRYRCAASACAWEGALLSRPQRQQRRGVGPRER
ncbi:hypothetical protein IP87_21070 [beta proteobacterium AAP121]|nr:hypothetical protein IP80_13675 [beta proteobacterium AAP65]KPF91369.1 hypothetical protein IP87_21070 [beta proteobacterium AAP121]